MHSITGGRVAQEAGKAATSGLHGHCGIGDDACPDSKADYPAARRAPGCRDHAHALRVGSARPRSGWRGRVRMQRQRAALHPRVARARRGRQSPTERTEGCVA